jgi:hypothetical protein
MVVDVDLGEHFLVPVSAAGILVHLGDEFRYGTLPITDHTGRRAFRSGHVLVVDHQNAMVEAGDVALHDHAAADLLGLGQRDLGFFQALDPDGGTTPVVSADGLDHAGETHAVQCGFQPFLGAHHAPFGHGYLVALQQVLGLLLIAGYLHPDVAGAAGDGGADAFLVHAVAELDQRVFVEADVGNATACCLVHDACRAGPKP